MSIVYLPANQDFRTTENTIRLNFIKQKLSTKENDIIVNRYVNMFDKHFLHFITQRQQRDLAILQYAIQFLLQQTVCSKKDLQRLQMSKAFPIENGHIQVDDSIVPVDWKLNILRLEQEIAMMKSIYSFMQNIIAKHATDCDEKTTKTLANMNAKMEKIKKLTDKAMITRITNGKKCMDYIYNKLQRLKSFDEILENTEMHAKLAEDYTKFREYLHKVKVADLELND